MCLLVWAVVLPVSASEAQLDQLERARQQIAEGRYPDARALAVGLCESRDTEVAATAWNVLGFLCEQRKQPQEAVRAYAKATNMAAIGSAAWCRSRLSTGLLAEAAGEHQTALTAFDDVLGTTATTAVKFAAAMATGDLLMARPDLYGAETAWRLCEGYAEELYADKSLDRDGLARRRADLGQRFSEASLSEDEVAFRRAEELRTRKEWPAAEAAYRGLLTKWPASQWAPPSSWAIGVCLLRTGHAPAVIAWWKAFIAIAPSGAWRGQAYISLGDAALKLEADADEAERQYQAAERGYRTSATLLGWPEAAYAINQRMGLISYAGGAAGCRGGVVPQGCRLQPTDAHRTGLHLTECRDVAGRRTGRGP